MKSEWKVREESAFLSKPAYQVYRLKDREKADTVSNREVKGNYNTKEYAEMIREKATDWHTNSPVWHPPYQVKCAIRCKDGSEYEAALYHLNERYHTHAGNPDKWRVTKHEWIEDNEVTEWKEI